MAEIKWIKITTDIFDDEKVLLLEGMPEADSIIVIWFKLLCLAGKQNNNGVFMLNDRIVYTDKMLATIFRRKESTVQMALRTFESLGMIEIVDGVVTIPNWEKHQSIDKLERIREQTRLRVSKHREKQRALLDRNVTVTESNATDKDKDKDKDIYINILSGKPDLAGSRIEIIKYLNEKTGKAFRHSSKATARLVDARLKEGYSIDDFKTVIRNKADEWMGTDHEQYLRPETLFAAAHFESYLNQKRPKKKGTISQEMQHEYDLEDLRRRAKE